MALQPAVRSRCPTRLHPLGALLCSKHPLCIANETAVRLRGACCRCSLLACCDGSTPPAHHGSGFWARKGAYSSILIQAQHATGCRWATEQARQMDPDRPQEDDEQETWDEALGFLGACGPVSRGHIARTVSTEHNLGASLRSHGSGLSSSWLDDSQRGGVCALWHACTPHACTPFSSPSPRLASTSSTSPCMLGIPWPMRMLWCPVLAHDMESDKPICTYRHQYCMHRAGIQMHATLARSISRMFSTW